MTYAIRNRNAEAVKTLLCHGASMQLARESLRDADFARELFQEGLAHPDVERAIKEGQTDCDD